MARKLTTEFVKVATSGPTIDGRNIDADDIAHMAESYDPEEYTANIWYEHIRYFGNLGKVVELKAEEDSKGRMCLFARLAPTDDLIYMNNRGQKLFTSIEIQPNFADSGKAYLAGLAVTDSPASIGTSELQFSRAQHPENYFTSPLELSALELEDSQGLIGRFLKNFGREQTPTPEPTAQGSDAMNEQQFNQLMGAVTAQKEQIQALEQKFAAQQPAKPEGDGNEPEAPETVSVEAFNELKTQFEELQTKFNAALQEENPGTNVPAGTGGADEEVI